MDHSAQPDLPQHHAPSLKKRWKTLVEEHPTALIIGSFILLPFVIFGIVLLGLRLKNGSTGSAELTPTPIVSSTPRPTESEDEEEEDLEPTDTPKKTPTKTSTPKPTTSVTATPNATAAPTKQANLYFQAISCTYIASGSAIANLENATIPSANVPDTATCKVIFQNSEDVETGDIWYMVNSDNDQHKKANVGKLKKGNYPTSEFKEFDEVITLKKNTGSHELKFELNHDKTFSESKYDDNYRPIKYTVQ